MDLFYIRTQCLPRSKRVHIDYNKIDNVHSKVILRRIHETIIAMEN